jgi:hypothetical protein
MDSIFPLEQLVVIGSLEVPISQPALPRLLSVIFAVRDTDTVLFPPYTLGELEVIRPVISRRAEFEDLLACEEVSAIGPIAAQPEHELWFDDQERFHYGLALEARRAMDAIFQSRCKLAKWALRAESFEEARVHAMIAYSANTANLEPLVLRAAAELRMIPSRADQDTARAELALTELMAEAHLPLPEFQILYRALAEKGRGESSEEDVVGKESPSRCKLQGLATKKPKSSEISFRQLVPV